MVKNGVCKRCGAQATTSSHHPLPRRHYGKGKGNRWQVELCANCHRQADEITFAVDRQVAHDSRQVYADAFYKFMKRPFP